MVKVEFIVFHISCMLLNLIPTLCALHKQMPQRNEGQLTTTKDNMGSHLINKFVLEKSFTNRCNFLTTKSA